MVRIIGSGTRRIDLTDCEFKDLVMIARKLSARELSDVSTGNFTGKLEYACIEVQGGVAHATGN